MAKNNMSQSLFSNTKFYDFSISGINHTYKNSVYVWYYTYGTVMSLTLDFSSYSFFMLTNLTGSFYADGWMSGGSGWPTVGLASRWNKQVKVNSRQIENINTYNYTPDFSINFADYNTFCSPTDIITITNTCTSSTSTEMSDGATSSSTGKYPSYYVSYNASGFN